MVIQSLENIGREELNRHIANINFHKINVKEDEDIVIASTNSNPFDHQDDNNNKLSAFAQYLYKDIANGDTLPALQRARLQK